MNMEEFIKNNGNILKIENPLSLFQSVLSLGNNNPKVETERWQTLNTLMAINNHRRIDHLERNLASEKARVRFIEDLNGQINEKVTVLEDSMMLLKRQVKAQNKNLMTILMLVKLISKNSKEQEKEKNIRSKALGKFKEFGIFLAQNGMVYGVVQILMRIFWIDTILDSLTELLKLTNFLSKRSLERSKFVARLSVSIALFVILRKRIKSSLEKFGKTLSIFTN